MQVPQEVSNSYELNIEEVNTYIQHYSSMVVIIWNCRGAGKPLFKPTITELFNIYKPDIMVIVETHIHIDSLIEFFGNLGLTNKEVSEPVGRSGGIWVTWNPISINFESLSITRQAIHFMATKLNYGEWIFSAVYASPHPRLRRKLWDNLFEISENIDILWLVAGDFNDHIGDTEKRSFEKKGERKSKHSLP